MSSMTSAEIDELCQTHGYVSCLHANDHFWWLIRPDPTVVPPAHKTKVLDLTNLLRLGGYRCQPIRSEKPLGIFIHKAL
jgi:hypothetical protein